jgi:ABC-type sugar transport system substrate-binding protein
MNVCAGIRRPFPLALLALLLALVVVANVAATTAKPTAGNPGVAEAKKLVKPLLKGATSIGTNVPLSKKPPTGKTIIGMACNLPVCLVYTDTFVKAAKLLGWKGVSLPFVPTPEAILAKVRQAIRMKPDGIVINGVESSVYEAALPEAAAAHIPIVSQAVPMTSQQAAHPKAPIIAVSVGLDEFSRPLG